MDFEVDTFHLEILTRGEKTAEMDERTIDRRAGGRNVETGRPVVGLGFWNLARDEVLRLVDGDPGVRAGLYVAELVQFICPKDAITFKEP